MLNTGSRTDRTNRAPSFSMRTRVTNVDSLLIHVVASREALLKRTGGRDRFGAVEAWDKVWQPPTKEAPTFKFRNDDLEEFGTNYYVLTELVNSKIHPFRKRFLSHVHPRIHVQHAD